MMTLERRQEWNALPYFVIAFLGLAMKSQDALSNPQFWAEDAAVFFQAQYNHLAPQLFAPYAGYLLVVPRIIAWVASFANPTKAPLIYNLASTALGAGSIAFVVAKFRGVVPPVIVLTTFLLTPTNGEIFGTVTNAQWLLQFPLAICCLTENHATSERRAWITAGAVLLMALTGPFSILVAIVSLAMMTASFLAKKQMPWAFDGYLANWNSKVNRRAISAVLIGAVVQGCIVAHELSPPSGVQMGWIERVRICFLELTPIHVFGFDFMRGKIWLLFYLFLIGTLIASKAMRGDKRLLLLAMIAYAAIATLAPLGLKEIEPLYQFGISDRYFYVTKVVLWWCVFGAIAAYVGSREAAGATIVLLAMVLVLNPGRLTRPPLVDFQWKHHAQILSEPGVHTIPINPAGWTITVESTKEE